MTLHLLCEALDIATRSQTDHIDPIRLGQGD